MSIRNLSLGALAAFLAAGACRSLSKEDFSPEIEQNIRRVDFSVKESRTLSGLAKLEEAISSYYQAEKNIPPNLDALIPKYLAEMPSVELSVRGHKDTAAVRIYPSDLLKDGRIDGPKLRDTGRWGYVFNDRQVVVFVDCTHKSSRGRPWYQERGVF